jgi:sugar phosphate permease
MTEVKANRVSPTHIRYLIIGIATLLSIVLYLHRHCLAFLERSMQDSLRLTDEQNQWITGVFFWSYALAQVPAGWFGDRLGVRHILTLYILLWSLCTGLVGAATAFAMFFILRLACGLAQAGAYPSSASLIGKWMPLTSRGFASGVVFVGGRLGLASAPVITAYLLVAFAPGEARLRITDLFDVPGLCQHLRQSDDTPQSRFGRRILTRLPPPVEEAVAHLSQAQSPGARRSEQIERLTAGLNQVLKDRDLCRPEDVRDLPLEHEAVQLARAPRGSLSESQVERLNRLVFEAAFPKYVQKMYVHGWRPVWAAFGAAGILAAALFWFCFRERPSEHPWCNSAEVALVEANRPPSTVSTAQAVGALPIRSILASRSMWLISLCQFGTTFAWVFLGTWLPRYLDEVHHVPVLERGWLAGLPLLVGMVGGLAGGWTTDRLTRSLGLRWGRCLPMALPRFVAMAAFLTCIWLPSAWTVTLALIVVATANDLGMPPVWAYTQDVGGRYVGTILGWNNMLGNLGAAFSSLVALSIKNLWGWNTLFLLYGAAYLLGGIFALGVDARVPIVGREERMLSDGPFPTPSKAD